MRVNVYAEEMTDRIEIVTKEIDGNEFTALRFYLYMPVTLCNPLVGGLAQVKGPFIHREGDDDSSAVTFWGKSDLRIMLRQALDKLDEYYSNFPARDSKENG